MSHVVQLAWDQVQRCIILGRNPASAVQFVEEERGPQGHTPDQLRAHRSGHVWGWRSAFDANTRPRHGGSSQARQHFVPRPEISLFYLQKKVCLKHALCCSGQSPTATGVSAMRRKGVQGLRWGELSLEDVTKQT